MKKRTLEECLADPNSTWEEITASMPDDMREQVEAEIEQEVGDWKRGFAEFIEANRDNNPPASHDKPKP